MIYFLHPRQTFVKMWKVITWLTFSNFKRETYQTTRCEAAARKKKQFPVELYTDTTLNNMIR